MGARTRADMIDQGVLFDPPMISNTYSNPYSNPSLGLPVMPSFLGEQMSISAPYMYPPDMSYIGVPQNKFSSNTSTGPTEERTRNIAPSDESERPSAIRISAERWASRQGFSADQLTEFGHLMGMVCSTFIPKYKISALKEIDSGSFGKIYSTHYDGVPVAVKQISNKAGETTIVSKMRELLLELRVLVRVRHPNVVTFWGTATEFPSAENAHAQPYIGLVFELCENGSLHHALFESKKELKISQKLKIAHQCSLGLMYLHHKRVIHRDINPRNILLTSDYSAKIADFGCARVLSGNATSLKTTTISGSPAYMAPEQMMGAELTEAVDTWALAVMLWEIMMDQKPFDGRFSDFNSLKTAIIRGEQLHIPTNIAPYPSCYANIIILGMQYKPNDRPAMSYIEGELGSAIEQYEASEQIQYEVVY